MFKNLFHFWSGYVIIRIEGKNTEQFINGCVSGNLPFRMLKRHGSAFASAEISPRLYHGIKLFARDYDCRISVIKRGGLPFLLLRLKKRKTFCMGFAAAIILLVWLCSRVWVIEIPEPDPAGKLKIAAILRENGIVCGMPKSALNASRLQQEVLSMYPEYTRFYADVHGTKLTVDVRYGSEVPEIDPADRARNIVAAHDGVIEKLVVRRGHSVVSAGAFVTEGQLLISGVTPITNYGDLYVFAEGDVLARTERVFSDSLPLKYTGRIKTGKSTKKYCITLFGKEFNLFLKAPSYTHYDGEISETPLKFFGEYFLPGSVRIYKYNEVSPTPVTRTGDEAEKELKTRLYTLLVSTVGEKNIISHSFDVRASEESVTVTLKAQCLENIAKSVEITFEEKPFLRENITPEAITQTTQD